MCQPQGTQEQELSYVYGVFHLADSWSAVNKV